MLLPQKRVMSSLKQKQEEDLGIRKRHRKRKSHVEDDGFINDGDEFQKFEARDEREKDAKEKHREKASKKVVVPVNLNVTSYKNDKYTQFKYDKGKSEKLDKCSAPNNNRERSEKEKSRNNNKTGPPPMSFEELMKMAQKKQAEPMPRVDPLLELEKLEKKKESLKDEERPLTAKEKKEMEEERIRKLKKMGKLPPEKENEKAKKLSKEKESLKKVKSEKDVKSEPLTASNKSKYFATPSPVPPKSKPPKTGSVPQNGAKNAKALLPPPPPPKPTAPDAGKKQAQLGRQPAEASKKQLPFERKEPKQVKKPLQERKFSSPHSFFPRKSSGPAPPPKRRIDSDDDDDEYDSEMDDFIDDGEEEMDYSSEIAKMFRYDKSKFRYVFLVTIFLDVDHESVLR